MRCGSLLMGQLVSGGVGAELLICQRHCVRFEPRTNITFIGLLSWNPASFVRFAYTNKISFHFTCTASWDANVPQSMRLTDHWPNGVMSWCERGWDIRAAFTGGQFTEDCYVLGGGGLAWEVSKLTAVPLEWRAQALFPPSGCCLDSILDKM